MIPHWSETEWAEGLGRFGTRLRSCETTAEAAARRALHRIAEHDAQVRAFVHVDPEQTLAEARRIDALLREGRDLGPLMGVPVAVKDLFAVDGMPTCAGSRLDVSHAIGPEGSLVARLRAAGAVILGKTRTIEFAAGAHNTSHPTPWNPADRASHRSPGGSSSGSAAAVAAGFCPVAIGSDTGGSVRAPAALCGIVGHKFTAGTVTLDGVFALCPALDSAGLLTISTDDALCAAEALLGRADPPPPVAGPRLGVPASAMLSGLDARVAAAFEVAVARLRAVGAEIEILDWPDAEELDVVARIFASLVPAVLIETLGINRVDAEIDRIDPVARHRLSGAAFLESASSEALTRALAEVGAHAAARMTALDAVIFPTSPVCAPLLEELRGREAALAFAGRSLCLTRMTNAWGMTACSIPISTEAEGLPVGLDVALPAGCDLACVALAGALQAVVRPTDRNACEAHRPPDFVPPGLPE